MRNLKMLPKFGFLLIAGLYSLNGCRPSHTSSPSEAKAPFLLSRDGFLQELLYPQATPRTPQFDDYTDGSYHVDKLGMLEGIRSRRETSPQVIGFLVVGPFGPLWAYSLACFIREETDIRMNYVLFAHARITVKSTRLMTNEEFNTLWQPILQSKALRRGIPSFEVLETERIPDLPLEWRYDILVADWTTDPERVVFSPKSYGDQSERSEDTSALFDAFEKLTERTTLTYSSDLSEEDSVYRPVENPE